MAANLAGAVWSGTKCGWRVGEGDWWYCSRGTVGLTQGRCGQIAAKSTPTFAQHTGPQSALSVGTAPRSRGASGHVRSKRHLGGSLANGEVLALAGIRQLHEGQGRRWRQSASRGDVGRSAARPPTCAAAGAPPRGRSPPSRPAPGSRSSSGPGCCPSRMPFEWRRGRRPRSAPAEPTVVPGWRPGSSPSASATDRTGCRRGSRRRPGSRWRWACGGEGRGGVEQGARQREGTSAAVAVAQRRQGAQE